MMSPEQHAEFPTMRAFLELNDEALDRGSEESDKFTLESEGKLPASIDGLGTVLSMLYRAACCAWGCRGGNHQVEWLAGRVVNQALCAYRLMRAAYYDESLMLIRGIGEIANLLCLFTADARALAEWEKASRKERLGKFGPGAVRNKLKKITGSDAPIDNDRYHRLCEIGAHPVPGFAPGHYTGSGRPVLGGILQHVGVYVCVTEASFAVAWCALSLSKLLGLPEAQSQAFVGEAYKLIGTLGAFSVMNYEELLEEVLRKSDERDFN